MRGHRDPPPPLDGRELAAIFAGGVAGALARMALAEALPHAPGTWPWATLAANLAGAFLLGVVVARVPSSSYRRPFAGIGACGALTTFATLQLELLELLDDGAWVLASTYAAVSLAGGLAAVRLGLGFTRGRRLAA
jgi:CrcB protein